MDVAWVFIILECHIRETHRECAISDPLDRSRHNQVTEIPAACESPAPDTLYRFRDSDGIETHPVIERFSRYFLKPQGSPIFELVEIGHTPEIVTFFRYKHSRHGIILHRNLEKWFLW